MSLLQMVAHSSQQTPSKNSLKFGECNIENHHLNTLSQVGGPKLQSNQENALFTTTVALMAV